MVCGLLSLLGPMKRRKLVKSVEVKIVVPLTFKLPFKSTYDVALLARDAIFALADKEPCRIKSPSIITRDELLEA